MFSVGNAVAPMSSHGQEAPIIGQATRVNNLINSIAKALSKLTDKSAANLDVIVNLSIELINELRKIDNPDDSISKFIELQKSLIDIKKASNSRDLTYYSQRITISIGMLGALKGASDIAAGIFKYDQGAGKESEGGASTVAGVFTTLASLAAIYAAMLYAAKNLENNHGDIKKGALDFSAALKGVRKSLSDRATPSPEEDKASVRNLYKLSTELRLEIESLATSSSAQWDMTNPARRNLLAASRSIEKIIAEHTFDEKLTLAEMKEIDNTIREMIRTTPDNESNTNVIRKLNRLYDYTTTLQGELNSSTMDIREKLS